MGIGLIYKNSGLILSTQYQLILEIVKVLGISVRVFRYLILRYGLVNMLVFREFTSLHVFNCYEYPIDPLPSSFS